MDKQVAALLKYMKSPYTLIGAVIFAGLCLNLYLISALVVPAYLDKQSVDQRVSALEQQKSTLENRPIPAKVTDSDVEGLLRQVPTQEETARFILGLKEIEQSSGAIIESIGFGNDAANKDPLAAFRTGASNGNPNNANSAGNAGNTQQPLAKNPASAESKSGPLQGVEESPMTLQIIGTYPQTSDFLNRLYQMERVVNVKQWMLQTGDQKGADPNNPALAGTPKNSVKTGEPREKVRLQIKLVIYASKGYAGKFKDLTPLSVKEVDKRVDPTWSEEHFHALLQALNP